MDVQTKVVLCVTLVVGLKVVLLGWFHAMMVLELIA